VQEHGVGVGGIQTEFTMITIHFENESLGCSDEVYCKKSRKSLGGKLLDSVAKLIVTNLPCLSCSQALISGTENELVTGMA